MGQKLSECFARRRPMEWGLLYLRMLLGGGMLLHNIGKMQNYNEIINSYPSLLYIENTASFVIIMVAEVLLGVMLILGYWVRFSAAILTLGMMWIAFSLGFPAGEVVLLYAAACVVLVISGGGEFSFDAFAMPLNIKKSDQKNTF